MTVLFNVDSELVDVKNSIAGRGGDHVFVVTTGRGRRKKAHVADRSDGDSCLCGRGGKNTRLVDAETVKRFYSVCSYCLELVE